MAENNDLLKKIRGLFIVEDESSKQATTPENAGQNTAQSQPTIPQTTYAPPPPILAVGGTHNSKIYDSLMQALETNNMQGFDYFEFRGSLLSLAKMPMDEATRFQSAYAMAQTMGTDTAKLTDSAAHYLNVLKNEELKFQQALENQRKSGLGAKEQEIVGLENAVKQKAELLKQITLEIQQHQTKIEEIKQQIGDAGTKIAQAQNDFAVTYNSLTGQIQQDIENIKKHIK